MGIFFGNAGLSGGSGGDGGLGSFEFGAVDGEVENGR